MSQDSARRSVVVRAQQVRELRLTAAKSAGVELIEADAVRDAVADAARVALRFDLLAGEIVQVLAICARIYDRVNAELLVSRIRAAKV
jgi:hypothetical protein